MLMINILKVLLVSIIAAMSIFVIVLMIFLLKLFIGMIKEESDSNKTE